MKASIKFLFLSAFISITLLSVAHEYWIAPVKYKVKSKEAFSVNCYAGEDFKEAIWAKRKDRTLQVNIFHEKNKNDINKNTMPKHSKVIGFVKTSYIIII